MGLRLREIRNRRGLSPQQMCARLGVKADRYRKWENGTNGIPLDYAVEVCEILRCSLDELLGRVIPALSAFYLRVDDFAPFVHFIRAFRAFHASCAARAVPFGTRQGRKKPPPRMGTARRSTEAFAARISWLNSNAKKPPARDGRGAIV